MATRLVTVMMAVSLALVSVGASAGLLISDAWIREAPPKAKVMAAYMDLQNDGAETIIVQADVSSDFERIEIHDMSVEAGMMTMKKMDKLKIEPGETVKLNSGGMHIMLFKPTRQLRDGDQAMIALKLNNGERKELLVKVKKVDGDSASNGHAHDHSEHHSH